MLILLITLLGGVSCTREEMPSGGCSLRVVFDAAAPRTKTDPEPDPADGSAIVITEGTPDLVILVANSSGTIVATYPDSERVGIVDGAVEGTATASRTSVSFAGLTGGVTYTVYAFANARGLWTMKNGETTVTSLTALTSSSDVEALQFHPEAEELESDGSLAILNERMPMTAKGTVTLTGNANGEIPLSLKRCVAKVTAVFENQYGEDLSLYEFSNTFYKMFPSTGYVIPHEEEFPVANADAGSLVLSEDPLTITDDESASRTRLVFPSEGPYTCDVSFYTDSEKTVGNYHSYLGLPVHDYRARDIAQLARNQYLTITTRISKGKQVSFNFVVADWGGKTETVEFN